MSQRSHRAFRLFWAGDAANQFGSAVQDVALPLVAATALAASPARMGLLAAAGTAAFLVVGLPAGALVDRVRKRPLMAWTTTARAALLLTVPVAWWLDVLTFTHLVLVALGAGVLTVFFDVASQSFLPALVPRAELPAANGRLTSVQQVARLLGRPGSGVLAQAAGSANAVLGVVAAYASSALLLRAVDPQERVPERSGRRLWTEIGEGLRFVLRHRLVLPTVLCTATCNFFHGAYSAVSVLFMVRDLALPEGAVGLLLAVGGAGGALAGATSGWFVRIGQVRLIWVSMLCTQPAWLLVPLAEPGWKLSLLVVGLLVTSVGTVLYNVAQVSLRQALCPDHLLGRMNASVRCIVWGAMPLGALTGGLLAESLGVRGALWVAAAGLSSGVLWVLGSPLRRMRDVPSITTVEGHG
ncbi:MFS transporter [Saccharothrix coeruleofusca]|uniref:MFS transporter n=1 Tax=Saccharothrix coeruleofusca TaxID=33919 RepID=A0A918AIE6_9PSEU|nr:MFS transporter [Saccharothrix coeruleofusca]GGP40875.1 MFS transporter [Saccharothrix coeruleofusca]